MGARLVGKFAYIKNMEHIINQLEYAGNKIAHQDVVFEDGRVKEQDGCTKLKLSDEEIKSVSYIKLFYKDGGYKKLDYDDYTKLVSNKEEKITISKIEALDGENLDEFEMSSSMVENKEYHELKDLDVKKYLSYIAERPGAEKEDGHGLFGINGNITTKEAVELALEHPDSIFWTCIISMRGEDGKRTGFDNRAAWKRLVIAKAPEIAKAYNISLENLVVNAGYHCNTDNDHVHITFYSKDKREGFVKGGKEGMQKASKRVLSLFLNDIFKDDVKEIQSLMDRSRQSIKTELKNHMLSLSQNDITDEKLVNMFVSLSDKIAQHKGKHDYAYLNSNTKQSVNELLRYVLKSNDNLSVLFKQLMNSKLEYIHMYNQFPEDVKKRDGETNSDYHQRLQNVRKNIDDKIQEAEDKIFSPQKGQATLQNIVVHSISDYIKERASPLENQPATKEKNIFDNPIPPPPADKPEILATMDDFRNLVTFDEIEIVDKLTDGPLGDDWIDFTTIREALAENRAVLREDELDTIEEMDDYYIAELPNELSEIQDDITADVKIFASETRIVEKLTEPPKKATATKEKKVNTPKSPQYEFSKSIYNDISKSAYKACSTLFNPNECNTNLQKELLIQLKQMNKLSSDEKKNNKEYKECATKSFKIMMADADFYDKFNSSIEKHTEEYLKKNNYDVQSREIVTEYINNVRSGDKLNSAHWYSMFFSDNINDYQYFQLMKAYEEFNKPLRKEMRRNIIEHLDEVSPVLQEIRQLKQYIPNYLKDEDVNPYIRNKISEIWATVVDTPEYEVFVNNNIEVFEEYMEPSVVEEYQKRFKTTLDEVGQLMRPHFYVITQAEHLDVLQLSQSFKNQELFSPVKSIIKKCLDNSITDYSYSSQFLKQELLKDKDTTTEILRCLYSQTDIKPVIDKWAENVIKSSGVEDIAKYYEEFQLFMRGEPCECENLFNYNKLTNYIRYYKASYVEQAYSQIKKAMQPEMPKKHIFKLLSDNLTQSPEEWKELHSICEKIKNAETEEVTALKQEQEKLINIIGQKSIYEDVVFSQYISSVNQAFQKHCGDNNIALSLENRFLSDMYSGDLWTAPNGYISFFAQFVPENLVKEKLNDTELFVPVKSVIKKCLDNSITDYSYSSQFLKQELLKDKDTTTEILRCLYSQTDIKPVIDKWAENAIKASGVEDVKKYYDGFQSFLRGEPCEYENLFNYNKLTNYIRYYKESYVEQAYKQIKKSVKTDALKQHLADVFDGDLQQNNKDWIKLYEHIKNPPKEDDENAINKYQSQSKELVLNIFNRVLHNNKDINLYISQVNTEFNKHSGDNNISLTLENRLENDIYSGDLYTEPNRLIFSFAEKLPQNYFKMILHSEKSKQLLKPVYKNITDSIYGKLSLEGDNDVKILISQINETSKRLEGCDYPERLEIMNECQQLTANLLQSIDNSELSEQINKLEKHLQKEIISSTPEELQADIEKLKSNLRNGSFSVPYNYIIFSIGENKNETYGKAVMSVMKNEVKDINSEIYKNLYEVLSHRKGKRERSPVYKLLCEVNNASTKEERNKITTKILEEFRQNPNFNKQFNKVKSNFCENLSKCCTIDNTENIFEQTILFGDFTSPKNTIEFMAQQSENIIKKINRQKAFRCVKLMCGTLAYALYDEAYHQMQRNLSQKNTLNRGINKFITKKQNQQQNNYLSY